MCKLGDRLGQHNLVMETLQAVRLSVSKRRAACNTEDRASVCKSSRKTRQTIAKANSRQQLCMTTSSSRQSGTSAHLPAVCCHEATSSAAADFSISFRCLHSNSLVSRVDQLDTCVCTSHQESIKMATMQTKDGADAQLMETLSQEVTSQQFATFRLLEFDAVARHGVWVASLVRLLDSQKRLS